MTTPTALEAANRRCLDLEATIGRMLPVVAKAGQLADCWRTEFEFSPEALDQLEAELVEAVAAYRKAMP